MTMTAVQEQLGLHDYIITYVEFTVAGQVPHTVSVQAHSVEMDREYVKLLRAEEGVVFAVPYDRFASLTLDDADPRAPLTTEFPGG